MQKNQIIDCKRKETWGKQKKHFESGQRDMKQKESKCKSMRVQWRQCNLLVSGLLLYLFGVGKGKRTCLTRSTSPQKFFLNGIGQKFCFPFTFCVFNSFVFFRSRMPLVQRLMVMQLLPLCYPLEQCFPTFFCSRHPCLVFKVFGGTPG